MPVTCLGGFIWFPSQCTSVTLVTDSAIGLVTNCVINIGHMIGDVGGDAVAPWWIEPDDIVPSPPPPSPRCRTSCHLWFVGEGGGVSTPHERLLVRSLGLVEDSLVGGVDREPVGDALADVLGNDRGVVGVDVDVVEDLPRFGVVTVGAVQQGEGDVEVVDHLLVDLDLDSEALCLEDSADFLLKPLSRLAMQLVTPSISSI